MKPILLLVGLVAVRAGAQEITPTPEAVPHQTLPFDWKIRPKVGSHWIMRSFQRSQMAFEIPPPTAGQAKVDINVTSIQRFTMDYDVLSRDNQGATTVRLTYRQFDSSADTRMNGRPIKTPADKGLDRDIKRAFIGAALTMKVAPNGQVWSIQGLAELNRRAAAASPQDERMVTQMMSAFFNEKTLKKIYSQNIGVLPPHSLAVGDKYPFQIDLPLMTGPLNIGLKMKGERLLAARSSGTATIKESGTLDMDLAATQGTDGSAKSSAPPFKMNMKGAIKGDSLVDEASGLARQYNLNMTIHGNIVMPSNASAAKNAAMSVPITVRLSSRVVMEPVGEANGNANASVPDPGVVRNVGPAQR